jgi:hypothetical protein
MAFKKGQEKKGGRTQGTPNALTKTVKERVLDAFNELQQDPQANLITWGKSNPAMFYQIAAKLIPAAVEMKAEIEGVEQVFKIGNVEIKL